MENELEQKIEELSRRLEEQQEMIEKLDREIPRAPLDIFFLNALEEVLERSGNIAGWIFTPENIKSPENSNGWALTLDATIPSIEFGAGVTILNTATPFSGNGGLKIEHETAEVSLEVSGQGIGLGSQQVLMNSGNIYLAVFANTAASPTNWVESNAVDFRLTALPASNPGVSGRLWNNSGVLNIS